MAAGFRTGLRKNISLTERYPLAHEARHSETRLNSQHAVLDGTLDLSPGYCMLGQTARAVTLSR